jgi:hypothetical protein
MIEKTAPIPSCLFPIGDYRNEGQNPKNVFCALVPVKIVSVAWKQSTIEEQWQDQSCLFWRGDYRNTGYSPKKVLDLSPDKDGFSSLETKDNRRTASRSKLFVSASRLQGQKPQTRKSVLGSSPGEDVFCTMETNGARRT